MFAVRVLTFALRRALDGGDLYQQLCWQRPGWLGSVNSSSSMGAPFSTMNATRTPSDGLYRRNQDFAASKLKGEISHFKRDVRNLPDEIRDRGVRFETHPLHTEFAFLVADDKSFGCFKWVSPGFVSVVGIPI